MSRRLYRVPLDFDFPPGQTWPGYIYPGPPFRFPDCPDCTEPCVQGGLNAEGRILWKSQFKHGAFSSEHRRISDLLGDKDRYWCKTCHGHGDIGTDEQRTELEDHYEQWEKTTRHGPPTGDGWQLWQHISEGGPMSPVFDNPDDLAEWMVEGDGWEYLNASRWLRNEGELVGIAMTSDGVELPKGTW